MAKNFLGGLKKFLSEKSTATQVLENQNVIRDIRNKNLFRSLNGKEEEAVSVVDNRDITEGQPNNRVLITCDHASNDIKYTKLSSEEEHLHRSQHFFDIGAEDLSHSLSEHLKCLAVMSNYSKLLIDSGKPLTDS